MNYHFKVHKEGKGYWAECLELQGCQTQGDSKAELAKNMEEALNLFLDEPADSPVLFHLPDNTLTGANIVEVRVNPKVALAYLLRAFRHRYGWSQSQACKAIGMNGLFSYQRLERSKTANPRFETLVRIKQAYPEFELDTLFG